VIRPRGSGPLLSLVLLLSALSGCERCGFVVPEAKKEPPAYRPFWEQHQQIAAGLDVHDAFRYFSGHIKVSGNHPVMYADIGAGTITVAGRGGRQVIAGGDLEQAFTAYRAVLESSGYVPEEEQDAGDPNKLVYVLLDDILPSERYVLEVFSEEQNEVLKRVTTAEGFAYLSGNEGGAHDFPTVYGILRDGYKLNVIGRGVDRDFDLTDTKGAFRAYTELLKARGFEPAAADSGPPDAS
jgi:hypothetical protein